jgi:hypothetical protein
MSAIRHVRTSARPGGGARRLELGTRERGGGERAALEAAASSRSAT